MKVMLLWTVSWSLVSGDVFRICTVVELGASPSQRARYAAALRASRCGCPRLGGAVCEWCMPLCGVWKEATRHSAFAPTGHPRAAPCDLHRLTAAQHRTFTRNTRIARARERRAFLLPGSGCRKCRRHEVPYMNTNHSLTQPSKSPPLAHGTAAEHGASSRRKRNA